MSFLRRLQARIGCATLATGQVVVLVLWGRDILREATADNILEEDIVRRRTGARQQQQAVGGLRGFGRRSGRRPRRRVGAANAVGSSGALCLPWSWERHGRRGCGK